MITIKQILESTQFVAEAAMTTSGPRAEDHVGKYLQPDQIKNLTYRMAKDSGGAYKDEPVKIKKIVGTPTMGGGMQYHAHIEHKRGKSIVPIGHIMKPAGVGRAGSSAEQKEDRAVDDLHNSIRRQVTKIGGYIKVRHLGKTYNIAGARKVVKGDYPAGRKPKGDIILHDENGVPQIFLSHKAGANATDAQNYEGTSAHTEHPQVAQFISDLKKKFPKGLTNKQSFVRRITTTKKADKKLHKDVMFGSDSDSGQYGVNNVQSIAHGAIGLKPSSRGAFELTSDKFIHNDDKFDHKEHPIEFTARYMKDRKDNNIQNARIGIARSGSRPSSKEF